MKYALTRINLWSAVPWRRSPLRVFDFQSGDMPPHSKKAFTLIELLVVVTIIVVLLALLVPSLDSAIYAAEKAKCMVNQRTMVQGCQTYAADSRSHWPYWPGNVQPSAYDWRTPWTQAATGPAGFGMLPANGYLPATQLGKIAHCPNIDSSGAPGVNYVGMDRPWLSDSGAGGSYWSQPAWNAKRILGSYNYRAASWWWAGKGWIRTAKLGSDEVICVDLPDVRFGGLKYIHPDGYGRAFADGHASFFADPDREVETMINAYSNGLGYAAGHDATYGKLEEERLYPHLARQR